MSGRIRQQLGVLFLVVLVALVMYGCGGGGDEETTTTLRVATTAPPATATGDDLLGKSVSATEDTPADFTDAYKVKPMVLLFYVPGGTDDVKVLETLDGLTASFANYAFLIYDYKTPDAYGDLSSLLDVGYPPELVLINRDGVIEGIWNGYVDEGTLNQALVNLERK